MKTETIYSGEVWEPIPGIDGWQQVMTSWGTVVEDTRLVTNAEIARKGSDEYRCRPEPFNPTIFKRHPEHGVAMFDPIVYG